MAKSYFIAYSLQMQWLCKRGVLLGIVEEMFIVAGNDPHIAKADRTVVVLQKEWAN